MDFLNPNRNDIDAMPPALRAMLEAELAAGNEIAEVSHGFPAPPCGALIKMVRAIETPPGEGIKLRSWPNWNRCSGYTDEQGHFFLLSPPEEEPVQPTMDEIRERMDAASRPAPEAIPDFSSVAPAKPGRPGQRLSRFEESMNIDYEKWREGTGYDLEALKEMPAAEKLRIENKLVAMNPKDWRDIEALAALDTTPAREELVRLVKEGSIEERLAVNRYAAQLVDDTARTASLVEGLRTAVHYGGLSQTLDEVEDLHPPEVMEELFRGLLKREGEVAVHFAAMLFYLHGKADEPFDWNHRPFFLRFHTENPAERLTAFRELCAILGVDPGPVPDESIFVSSPPGQPGPSAPLNTSHEQTSN